MSNSPQGAAPAHIVTAFLRDGDRVLLCHRTPERFHFPDVWDLPGGHVEPGELPAASLVRELEEELGIDVAQPAGPPMAEIRTDAFVMQIWLIEAWTGTLVNAAPGEHDAIGWFAEDELGDLRLAHDDCLALFTKALAVVPDVPAAAARASDGKVRGAQQHGGSCRSTPR